MQHLIDAEVLRPLSTEAEVDEVLAACWAITDHWLPFLESTGQPVTYEQFQIGSQVIARVIHPYLIEHELTQTRRGTFYEPIFIQGDRDQAAAATSEYHHHRWSLGTH